MTAGHHCISRKKSSRLSFRAKAGIHASQIPRLLDDLLRAAALTLTHEWERGSQPSFRRRLEGGFTFEVQHFIPEYLGWSEEAEALTWGIIIRPHELSEPLVGHRREVGLRGRVRRIRPMAFSTPPFCQGEWVSQSFRGRMDAERVEPMMPGELGAVVEGDGLAPRGGQWCQYL